MFGLDHRYLEFNEKKINCK